jgi:hypothetical protein
MYNKFSSTYQEVPENRASHYQDMGYEQIDKHDLVAVFNPGLNSHRTVLRADLESWKNRGYFAEPTFVYHPECRGGKLVSAEKAAEMLKEGWYDTPAKIPDNEAIVERAVKQMKKGA